MFFSNLQVYRLPAPWEMYVEVLEEKLGAKPFKGCGSQDMRSCGWVSPTRDDRFVLNVNRQWMIALRTEEKLLPATVVRQFTDDRAEELEAQQGYKVGRKQLKEIKEAITQELLPRAFPRRRTIYAWIDPTNGWLLVDASSAARADELIAALHDTLDELPLKLLDTERSPQSAMADWLASGNAPEGFTIDRDCELRAITDEKASVRYARHPLEGDEIPNHLAAGKVPTRLALTFDDRISFVLTERLELKRLQFLDIIQEKAEQSVAAGDPQLESDFALMSAELARMLPEVIGALGGERAIV